MASRLLSASIVAAAFAAGGLAAGGAALAVHADQPTGGLSYFDGLRAGEAQGREEGRMLQLGQSLPAASRQPVSDAFKAGYVAGTNDAFAGYDGGWAPATLYVVTLERGDGPIVYRISSRVPLQPGVDYYLCPNGHDLCQQPRP